VEHVRVAAKRWQLVRTCIYIYTYE